MASYLRGVGLNEIMLFGSVARSGLGNDLDIAIPVEQVCYDRYIALRKRTIERRDGQFMTAHVESSLVLDALGIVATTRRTHLGNLGYPKLLGPVDALLLPNNWQEVEAMVRIQCDYDCHDPQFMANVARDALAL